MANKNISTNSSLQKLMNQSSTIQKFMSSNGILQMLMDQSNGQPNITVEKRSPQEQIVYREVQQDRKLKKDTVKPYNLKQDNQRQNTMGLKSTNLNNMNQSNNNHMSQETRNLQSIVAMSEIISEPVCKRRSRSNRW